jgi:hypothetical protein
VFVPREANAIAPFLATVLVPSPCSTLICAQPKVFWYNTSSITPKHYDK